MMYSQYAKNHNQDWIYWNRLKLIEKRNLNIYSSAKMYSYYMNAYLGILLI